jgi:thymidylate synthase
MGEQEYLNALSDLLQNGSEKSDRTGVGCISKFGCQLRYPLVSADTGAPILPLFTTKHMPFKTIWTELFFFLKGKTHNKYLTDHKCHIWTANSTRAFLDGRGLCNYPEGQLGPVYAFQQLDQPHRRSGTDS